MSYQLAFFGLVPLRILTNIYQSDILMQSLNQRLHHNFNAVNLMESIFHVPVLMLVVIVVVVVALGIR